MNSVFQLSVAACLRALPTLGLTSHAARCSPGRSMVELAIRHGGRVESIPGTRPVRRQRRGARDGCVIHQFAKYRNVNTVESSFEACAFHPSLGNESVAGQIIVSRWQVSFQSAVIAMEIPLERLHVRCGEGEDERLYFRDAAQPEWEIITSDFSILDLPAIAAIDNIGEKLSAEASRQEVRRRLRIVGYVAGACVVLACLGQLALSLMVRSLVGRMPPQKEREMGDALLAELKQEMVMIDDTNRVAEIAALAAPLTQAVGNSQVSFTFYLTEDDEPNAFALPGGHVVVTTGLLKMAERPEQVLGRDRSRSGPCDTEARTPPEDRLRRPVPGLPRFPRRQQQRSGTGGGRGFGFADRIKFFAGVRDGGGRRRLAILGRGQD